METVPVRFRDCSCPGSPHPDGDIAELRPFMDYAGGAEMLAAVTIINDDGTSVFRPTVEWPQHIGPVYIRRGVVGWNVVDDDGPVPVHPAVDELRWEDAYELADRADDLYGGQVLAPLVKRVFALTKAGRTNGSTQRPRKSSSRPRTP